MPVAPESKSVRNLSTCSSASFFSRSVRSSTFMRRCTSSCTLDITGVARPLIVSSLLVLLLLSSWLCEVFAFVGVPLSSFLTKIGG